MPFLNSLNYETTGDSKLPPILLLHGFMGSIAEWKEVVTALQSEFYCITIDLPGHGKSIDVPENDYSISSCANAIADTVNELKIEKVNLLGYSMGGRLALYVTLHYPERVNKLILESASPGLKSEEERLERKNKDNLLADKLLNQPMDEFIGDWYNQPLFASLKNFPDKFKQLSKERKKNNAEGLARSLRYLGTGVQPSLWKNLAELTITTLLIVGQLDTKFQLIANEMCALNKNINQQMVNDTGHNVHFEKPNMYAEIIKNFLK